jgi:hypothetical protein
MMKNARDAVGVKLTTRTVQMVEAAMRESRRETRGTDASSEGRLREPTAGKRRMTADK